MILEAIESEGLAHFSYLIGDEAAGVAAVIDPRRDVDVYLEHARRRRVRITHVLETHIHADFVSGSRELAARTGAGIHVGAADDYGFDHVPLRDGDVVELGDVSLRTLHTPGHTPEHVCFVVSGGRGASAPWGVFTGDTLFAGTVGRPDLLGAALADGLARALFRSLHEVLLPLGDGVQVFPAHGRGSPCGAHIGDRTTTTIGYERRHNPFLQTDDEERFVREVLESAPPVPFYYPRMKEVNARGPDVLGGLPVPPALDPDAFAARIGEEDVRILDTREIHAWGGAHIAGSLNIALRPPFPIWAGWMLRPEERLLLVVERSEDIDPVIRHLLRIGILSVEGVLMGGMVAWTEAGKDFERVSQMSVHELREHTRRGGLQIIDARSDAEWESGHVPGAVHAFTPNMSEHLDRLDPNRPTAVYCGSGYRASIAASVLAAAGFTDVHTVPGSILAWKRAGYPLERGEARAA